LVCDIDRGLAHPPDAVLPEKAEQSFGVFPCTEAGPEKIIINQEESFSPTCFEFPLDELKGLEAACRPVKPGY